MGEAADVLSKGMTNFINDYHKYLDVEENENYVASAFSAHLVLSMTAYGAAGKTAEEMRKTLYLPENDDEALKAFNAMIVNGNKETGCVFEIANKIYPADTFIIKKKFKNITKKFFRSECQSLNFEENEKSAAAINKWCSEKTRDKIKGIIKPQELCDLTRLILINAVYFKGSWSVPFNTDDTELHDFHVNTSTTVQVPLMSIQDAFQYRELKEVNAQSIILPYADSKKYMEIIVPRDIDGLSVVEKNLDKTTLSNEKSRWCMVNFKMPKFIIETKCNMQEQLKKMGMPTMFDEDFADFSNTTDHTTMRIFVSRVIQKAFIQVDESGCEAAAVTYVDECEDMCFGCFDREEPEIIRMKADRPFLFRIYDDNSRTFVFIGRVVNPLACSI